MKGSLLNGNRAFGKIVNRMGRKTVYIIEVLIVTLILLYIFNVSTADIGISVIVLTGLNILDVEEERK